ncbi:MAG: hypothetical protein GY795_31755 [Desulfobacterales bacterium]|nr:hypothetical protein [Desulfobacterales bacterium]
MLSERHILYFTRLRKARCETCKGMEKGCYAPQGDSETRLNITVNDAAKSESEKIRHGFFFNRIFSDSDFAAYLSVMPGEHQKRHATMITIKEEHSF